MLSDKLQRAGGGRVRATVGQATRSNWLFCTLMDMLRATPQSAAGAPIPVAALAGV